MKSLIALTAALTLAAGVADAADGRTSSRPVHWGDVANWTITAYPDSETCEIYSKFDEGSLMGVSFNAKSKSTSLFISNPAWAGYFKEGQVLPLTVATERKWGNFVATAYYDGGLMASDVDVNTVQEFALAQGIGFAVNGTKLTSLDLSHSKQAIAMGFECVAAMIPENVAAGESADALRMARKKIDTFADEKGPDGKLLRPDFDAVLPKMLELFRADPNRDLGEAYEMARRSLLAGAGSS